MQGARWARWAQVAAVVVAGQVTSTTIAAQPRTADLAERGVSAHDFPRVIPLAPRVFGYEDVREPGFTTVSLFVVGDSGVLLADGQGSPAATDRLLKEIRRITPLPVRWYVVGSDHGDHTAGNTALPPHVSWIVHATSRAQLQRDAEVAKAANARVRAQADSVGRAPPPDRVVVVPPYALSTPDTLVDVGGTRVRVVWLGRAHTGGDLMVHLPHERILFMSEAYLNRVFPAMRSAYPTEWVRVLDRALALPVDHFIPGHGFIESPAVSREELHVFRNAVAGVVAEVQRLHTVTHDVEEAVRQANWGELKGWFLAGQQGPIAVRRIYQELDGKLPP